MSTNEETYKELKWHMEQIDVRLSKMAILAGGIKPKHDKIMFFLNYLTDIHLTLEKLRALMEYIKKESP